MSFYWSSRAGRWVFKKGDCLSRFGGNHLRDWTLNNVYHPVYPQFLRRFIEPGRIFATSYVRRMKPARRNRADSNVTTTPARACVRLVPAFELFGLEIGWASDLNAIEIIRDRLEHSIEYRTIMILISKPLETHVFVICRCRSVKMKGTKRENSSVPVTQLQFYVVCLKCWNQI